MDDLSRRAVIGVDSGNTKTAAVCVTLDGELVAHNRVGPSNYQTLGPRGALEVLTEACLPLAETAAVAGKTLAGFGFGLTGLDRPRDEAVLDRVTGELIALLAETTRSLQDAPRVMVNDAALVLRAGVDDGIGVAVSSGTGGNCVGMGRDGRRTQVGGLTRELGDGGGACDIARAGLRAAGRARDGRDPPTRITDLLLERLGIESIEDIMEFMIPADDADDGRDKMGLRDILEALGALAPLVFRAAAEGDRVAIGILEDEGRDLGLSVGIAGARLGFSRDDEFPLVLGGGVLANAEDPTFEKAIVAEARTRFPRIVPIKLQHHPVLGAVLLALDALSLNPEFHGLVAPLSNGSLRRRVGPSVTGIFQGSSDPG
ncbi:MAG: hypothetical protein GXP54_02425 [Deltaproteobacteria bacterium]|nr:hypothetical protein [Deltaproteobacteria bacterium]